MKKLPGTPRPLVEEGTETGSQQVAKEWRLSNWARECWCWHLGQTIVWGSKQTGNPGHNVENLVVQEEELVAF